MGSLLNNKSKNITSLPTRKVCHRLTLDHIVRGTITLSEIGAQGAAGECFPLPRWLAVKRALINIQVSGDRCFANAVVRSLNIEKKNNTRLTPLLRNKITELDWTGVEFPTPLEGESIRNFEKNNNIGVAIYASGENDERENVVIRKRSPSERFGQIANIFLMTVFENSGAKHHFCAISRLSALIKGQGRRDGASYCSYCSARFFDKFARKRKEKGNKRQKRKGIIKTHQELCAEHEKVCQVITGEIFTPREKLPEPGNNILKFKKWDHLFKSPLRIYADLECALMDRCETEGESTMTYHNHEPIACSIRYVSEIPNLQFKPFNYRGPDAHKRLVKELKRVAFEIEKIPDLFAHHDFRAVGEV